MFGQLVSFDNLIPPFPIGVAAIFFFLQSHYIGMLRFQSSSFTFGCKVVIVGGTRVVSLRALLVVQREMDKYTMNVDAQHCSWKKWLFWLLSLVVMLLQQWISSMSMLRTSYQLASGDPTKKYINPSSFQLMLKSYGKELPTLTYTHHIRGSYQEDSTKKGGWKSGSWERITHKSTKEVIEKNVAYAVRLE